MSLLTFIRDILFFWKRKSKTVIPIEISKLKQSLHHYEKAASLKVLKYAKRHFIETEDLEALFEAELAYEKKKYQARHDFPHQKAIRDSDIGTAKKEKYVFMKENMSAESYRKYRSYRSRQRKKYPTKD